MNQCFILTNFIENLQFLEKIEFVQTSRNGDSEGIENTETGYSIDDSNMHPKMLSLEIPMSKSFSFTSLKPVEIMNRIQYGLL